MSEKGSRMKQRAKFLFSSSYCCTSSYCTCTVCPFCLLLSVCVAQEMEDCHGGGVCLEVFATMAGSLALLSMVKGVCVCVCVCVCV